MTFKDYFVQWLQLRCAGLALRTREQYAQLFHNHLCPALGELPLAQITASALALMLGRVCEQGHTRTAEQLYILCNSLLSAACRQGLIPANPCSQVLRPRHFARRIQFLDPRELQRFSRWCLAHPGSPSTAWLLAMACGLRRGELCGLRWSDVDLRSREIHINNQRQEVSGRGTVDLPPKSHASVRSVPLPDVLIRVLRAQKARQAEVQLQTGKESLYVLSGAFNGPLSPHRLDKALPGDLAAARCRRVTLHGLRHSMATAALAEEVPMKVLQELLGHQSMSTTSKIYTHVLASERRAAIDAIAAHMV